MTIDNAIMVPANTPWQETISILTCEMVSPDILVEFEVDAIAGTSSGHNPNSMKAPLKFIHLSLADALSKGPAPPGNLALPMFSHGSLVVELYTPVDHDPQKPHPRDEAYFVSRGKGLFFDGERRHSIRRVRFCSFRPGRFTASRTSHPTSSFGSYSMDRKEGRWMSPNNE